MLYDGVVVGGERNNRSRETRTSTECSQQDGNGERSDIPCGVAAEHKGRVRGPVALWLLLLGRSSRTSS